MLDISNIAKIAMDTAGEGITLSDPNQPDNPLVYVNKGFETLTGYSAEECIGKNCRFLQGNKSEGEGMDNLRRAIKAGEGCRVDILNYHKNGTPFWNRLTIEPIHDDTGKLQYFVGVQFDITAMKKSSEHLMELAKELMGV